MWQDCIWYVCSTLRGSVEILIFIIVWSVSIIRSYERIAFLFRSDLMYINSWFSFLSILWEIFIFKRNIFPLAGERLHVSAPRLMGNDVTFTLSRLHLLGALYNWPTYALLYDFKQNLSWLLNLLCPFLKSFNYLVFGDHSLLLGHSLD